MRKNIHFLLIACTLLIIIGVVGSLLPAEALHAGHWFWLSAVLLTNLILLGMHHWQLIQRIQRLLSRQRQTEKHLRSLRVAIERSPTSILVTNPQGVIEYVNPTICNFTGYSIEELLGQNASIFNSGQTPQQTHKELWDTLSRNQDWSGRFISRTRSGETYLEQVWIAPVFDGQQVSNYVAVKLDITEQEEQLFHINLHNLVLDKLSRNFSIEQIFNAIIAKIEQQQPDLKCAIFLCEPDRQHLSLAAASSSLPDNVRQSLQQITFATDGYAASRAAHSAKRYLVNDMQEQINKYNYPDTAIKAGLLTSWAEPVFDLRGKIAGVLNFFSTVTGAPDSRQLALLEHAANLMRVVIERSQNNALLKLAETVYQTSNEALVVTDANGTFIHVNPAFTRITGFRAEEAIGRNHSLLKSGRHSSEFYQRMWHSLNNSGRWQGEIWNKRKNGEIYPQLLSINSTYNDDGSVKFRVSLFVDISEQKANEELIWRQANFDTLTGLANRRYFQEVFDHAIKVATRNNEQLAVLFIDLDEFKPVNDQHGHQFGDLLLAETAKRINEPLRDTDIVARIGGDEFIVLLAGNPSQKDVSKIAQRISEKVLQPFNIDGKQAQISLSCGISMFPQHASTAADLIKLADIAMYQAKNQGRNQTLFYQPSMTG